MGSRTPSDAAGHTAPRSLLHVDVPATIAVDAGSVWTGVCARQGSDALDGACVGLAPGEKMPNDRRLELDLNDFGLWRGYHQRIYLTVEAMWDRLFPVVDVRVVFEEFTVPYTGRIPDVDWSVPREINTGLCARYDGAVGVPRDEFGSRHLKTRRVRRVRTTGVEDTGASGVKGDYYPPPLVGRRPESWSANDHPSGTRNHERSAFDAAAAAHLQLSGTGGG